MMIFDDLIYDMNHMMIPMWPMQYVNISCLSVCMYVVKMLFFSVIIEHCESTHQTDSNNKGQTICSKVTIVIVKMVMHQQIQAEIAKCTHNLILCEWYQYTMYHRVIVWCKISKDEPHNATHQFYEWPLAHVLVVLQTKGSQSGPSATPMARSTHLPIAWHGPEWFHHWRKHP